MLQTFPDRSVARHRGFRDLSLGLTALLMNAYVLAVDADPAPLPHATQQTAANAPPPNARAAPLNWDIGAAAEPAQKKSVPLPNQDVVPLEAITVHGKRDVLGESDRRLRAKIDALPCNGCDGKPFAPTVTEETWNLAKWALSPAEPVGHYPELQNKEPGDRANVFSQGSLQTPLNPAGGPGAPNITLSAPH